MSKNSIKSTIECFKNWRSTMNIVIKPKKAEDDVEKGYKSLSVFNKLANKNK